MRGACARNNQHPQPQTGLDVIPPIGTVKYKFINGFNWTMLYDYEDYPLQ